MNKVPFIKNVWNKTKQQTGTGRKISIFISSRCDLQLSKRYETSYIIMCVALGKPILIYLSQVLKKVH